MYQNPNFMGRLPLVKVRRKRRKVNLEPFQKMLSTKISEPNYVALAVPSSET